jgi:hypothetical protein
MTERFDDYLGLSGRLDDRQVMVFCGRSGAGKSSYIQWLTVANPSRHRDGPSVRVVDEIVRPGEWFKILSQLPASGLLLVASHLPAWFHRLIPPLRGRISVFNLDDQPGKISCWLANRGIESDAESVASFCREYGSNYTDAAMIIERYPGLTFAQALARFRKECRVILSPNPPTGL